MTNITRTVNTIIEGAYKLIGIYSEDRALSGQLTTEGLESLQEILDHFAATDTRIAYNSELNFNLTIDKAEYTLSKEAGADINSNRIVELKYVVLTDGDFDYPVKILSDEYYFNRKRQVTSTGRPVRVYLQNEVDTVNSAEVSRLVFFTLPDKAYSCTVKAKFVLDAVSLSQPLDEVPNYYHRFLKYALGRELSSEYPGSEWDNLKEKKYIEMLENITNASDVDLTARTGPELLKYGRGDSLGDFLSGN